MAKSPFVQAISDLQYGRTYYIQYYSGLSTVHPGRGEYRMWLIARLRSPSAFVIQVYCTYEHHSAKLASLRSTMRTVDFVRGFAVRNRRDRSDRGGNTHNFETTKQRTLLLKRHEKIQIFGARRSKGERQRQKQGKASKLITYFSVPGPFYLLSFL